jgi:integrase
MSRRGDALYERGKGKIKTWYLDIVIHGTRHQHRLGRGITRSVAQELAQVQRAAILKGEAGIGAKQKKDLIFSEARKRFEDGAKADKKPNTLRIYTACLDQLGKAFSGKRLSEITPWTLEAYKKRRGEGTQLTERPREVSDAEWNRRCRVAKRGAPVRANRELAVLKTLFNRCRDWGLYEGENPVSKVKFRREPRQRLRFLEPEEEARLLAAAKEPLRSLILLGLHTGLRVRAEALQLRWEDVDMHRGLLTVQAAYAKNGRMRSIPLNSVVRTALGQLKRTEDVVFSHGSIGRAFRKACAIAGIKGVTPHTLRHTFASRLVMSGADLRTVQELGGWQTIAMVERYSHLSREHKAKAVERLAEFPYAIPYAPLRPSARAPRHHAKALKVRVKIWSRRSGLNGRPAVYECEQDAFKKARCFKWFPRFLFEYRSLESFSWLY